MMFHRSDIRFQLVACSRCGTRSFLTGLMDAVEIDYATSGAVQWKRICRACYQEIHQRNSVFRQLSVYFNEHPGKRETLLQEEEQGA